MGAVLLEMLFGHADEKNKSAKEIILFGEGMRDRRKQDKAMNCYQESTKYKDYSLTFLNSIDISKMVNTDLDEVSFKWSELAERVWDQIYTRPRGNGCIFRFPSPNSERVEYTDDDLKELQEFLRYEIENEIDAHAGEAYIFIGSLWDYNSRIRIGNPILIEAPSIQCASSISEIYFRRQSHQETLTDWCAPIYKTEWIT